MNKFCFPLSAIFSFCWSCCWAWSFSFYRQKQTRIFWEVILLFFAFRMKAFTMRIKQMNWVFESDNELRMTKGYDWNNYLYEESVLAMCRMFVALLCLLCLLLRLCLVVLIVMLVACYAYCCAYACCAYCYACYLLCLLLCLLLVMLIVMLVAYCAYVCFSVMSNVC